MHTAITALLTMSLLCLPSVRADVLVVDMQGGELLQDAIDAANEGDTILVTSSQGASSQTAVIIAKSLTIVGDVQFFSSSFELRRVAIRNLTVGQTVALVNVKVSGPGGDGLILTNNQGAVRFHNVHAEGGVGQTANIFGQQAKPGYAGASVLNCPDVVFVHSSALGGHGADVHADTATASSPGGPGLVAVNSVVSFFGGGAVGGDGGEVDLDFTPLGSDGGPGAIVDGSKIHLHNSGFVGGKGGENDFGGHPLVAGGTGLIQLGASSVTALRDSTLAGGLGTGVSPSGAPLDQQGGAVNTLGASMGVIELEGGNPVREGDPLVLRGTSLSGPVLLAVGLGTDTLHLPSRQGVFTVGAPMFGDLLFLGSSPAITFTNHFGLGIAPELPVGFDAVNVYVQAIEAPGNSPAVVGEPEIITILDASF